MKITVQQAHFFDLTGIGNILPYPSFLEVDLVESSARKNTTEYYIAKLQGEIVGFAQIAHYMPNEAELVRLYVVPNYHRQGIGSRLVKKCFSVLNRGSRLTVKVEKSNLSAIIFYEVCGFKKVREVINSFGENLLEFWIYL